ncbi:MAG: tRNA (guanosine(46)-N7)-methyltransferase TrmB [Acidiferrobacteraceae bacterium]|nr:tRNA (guanosine(46)-N7)-methyltransferase TrmB [Acidiferrobacteraceae bacterium]|tara:strand:+ start:143 stop:841 length:699 start_codon:yes stop_codon:yes gene_type:complete
MVRSDNQEHSTRPIRSYVRREGRMTTAQKRAFETLWPKYGINNPRRLNQLEHVFGNLHSLTVEIGFGNGDNLINLASKNPETSYIGIDVYRPGAGRLMLELERLGLSNVRLLVEDAREILSESFIHESCDNILIYFPDPWPKKRHQKRRLIGTSFLHEIALRLKPGGKLNVVTDCTNYAKSIVQLINLQPGLDMCSNGSLTTDTGAERKRTKYESLGIKLGHTIFDIRACRR